ncbi:fatty acyl-CoA reductase wat-like isoform X2 [Bacillus rossius redtenbacheri]
MNKNLKGKRFDEVEAVKTASIRALENIKVEECQKCFKQWEKRLEKLTATEGILLKSSTTGMSAAGDTEVQGLYRDCGVLVTGATGFLGKLTIEKILRSCPGVRTVYALVRPKRGLSVDQRKKALLDNVVFDRMKRERPDSVDKIVFVAGDCSSPRLGLSDSDYHHLTQHVNIVLHLAATVRFNEHLKVAVDTNVKGTIEVINLCHSCNSLKAAVFVSTAYSNCHQNLVKEEFYDPHFTVEDTVYLLQNITEHELEPLCEKLISPWPNTYVFSKAVAEHAILTQGKDLPAVVVRPSIVISTIKEPLLGWVDNMYGPISIAVGVAYGILHVSYTNEHGLLHIIPADMVTNCIITSALTADKRSEDIPVYNIAMPASNPVTVKTFTNSLYKVAHNFPLKSAIWYPFVIFVNNWNVYLFLAFFLHFLPGCLLDLVLRLKGKKPIILNIYKKIQKHLRHTNYFTRQNWIFACENTKNLYQRLNTRDKELFAFDPDAINWDETLTAVGIESTKYLLNESPNDLNFSRTKYKMFYIAHTLLKIVLWGVAIYTLKFLLYSFYDRKTV